MSTASEMDRTSQVPWERLVRAAAVPVACVMGAAAVLTVLLATAAKEVAALPGIFGAMAGLLLGSGVKLQVAVLFFEGSGQFALVSLLVLAVLAILVSHHRFARESVDDPRIAGIGAAVCGVWWLVGAVVASVFRSGAGGGLSGASLGSQPRPLYALVAGASVWLAACCYRRFVGFRRALRGLAATSLVLWLTYLVVLAKDAGSGDGGLFALLVVMTSLLAGNVVVMLLVWPFGAHVQAGPLSSSFLQAAGQTGWLWLVPLVVIALVLWWAFSLAPARSRREFRDRLVIVGSSLWVALSVAIGLGNASLTGAASFLPGAGGLPLGVGGVPFSLLLPVLVLTALVAGATYVRMTKADPDAWARADAGEGAGAGDAVRSARRSAPCCPPRSKRSRSCGTRAVRPRHRLRTRPRHRRHQPLPARLLPQTPRAPLTRIVEPTSGTLRGGKTTATSTQSTWRGVRSASGSPFSPSRPSHQRQEDRGPQASRIALLRNDA
ncbi:MAG: hypothetical protein ACRDZ4_15125 [Egibacteraceae bacterium]